MAKGLIDRFRSLPMARSAVLSGRTVSDVVYNAGILVVLMLSGLAVGWRVHGERRRFLLAVALLLLFAFAMAWIGVWIGLLGADGRGRRSRSASWSIFPLTFLSNAFVPTETLPSWLQPIAEWNPVSALTAATRELFGNPNPFASGFPAEHPVLLSLIWMVAAGRLRAARGARTARSTAERQSARGLRARLGGAAGGTLGIGPHGVRERRRVRPPFPKGL